MLPVEEGDGLGSGPEWYSTEPEGRGDADQPAADELQDVGWIFDSLPGPKTLDEPLPWDPAGPMISDRTWSQREKPQRAAAAPFPLHVLPKWMSDRAQSIAIETQSPIEMAGSMGLVSLAAACAGKLDARATRGWCEGLNLFVLVVAPSGSAKSAVFSAMSRPLVVWEERLQTEARKSQVEAVQEHKVLEKEQSAREKAVDTAAGKLAAAIDELDTLSHRIEALRAAVAPASVPESDPAREALRQTETLAEKLKRETIPDLEAAKESALVKAKEAAFAAATKAPTWPKVICDDATPEALRRLMCENKGRIALLSSEGAGTFSHMGGRYSGGEASTDVYTQGYSNEPLRGDRQGDRREGGPAEGMFIARSWLTMGLATQVEVFEGAMRRPEFRDRGVMDRFLLAKPDVKAGNKDHVVGHDEGTSDRAQRTRETYLERFLTLIESLPDELEEIVFPDSVGLRIAQWMNTVEVRQRAGGELEAVVGWAAKAKGNCVRVVALLHVAATFDKVDGWRQPIADETVDQAIELMEWYLRELARHTPSLVPRDKVLGAVREVLTSLKSCSYSYLVNGHTITIGNLAKYCKLPDEKKYPELRYHVLEVLLARDWLREVDLQPRRSGRGTRRFVLHPVLRP